MYKDSIYPRGGPGKQGIKELPTSAKSPDPVFARHEGELTGNQGRNIPEAGKIATAEQSRFNCAGKFLEDTSGMIRKQMRLIDL